MSRIAARFAALKAEGRGALIPFLEAWDPDSATSMALLRGMPGAGADLIEIGCPFTDPMADGPTIQAAGRRLEITRDVIFDQHYRSREIHLFFNLLYKDFDYIPALDANGPEVDHIFPQSLLKSVRDVNEKMGHLERGEYFCYKCKKEMNETSAEVFHCDNCNVTYNTVKYKLKRPHKHLNRRNTANAQDGEFENDLEF